MAAQQRTADKEKVGKLLARLRGFHAAGDRVRPPVFVGREDELMRINWRAVRLGSVDGDKQGFTAIVQGPPGAGKTALMREFASRMNAAAPEKGRRIAAAVVPVRDLDQDADAAACAIAENTPLALEEAPPLPQRMLDIWRGALKKGGGRTFGTWPRDRLEADVLREALHLPRNGSPDSCLRALSRRLWRDRLAIVLCVDEAQNIQPSSRAGKFLRAIHENLDQLPIMTLAFGLPDTREQLGKAGLSRLADGSVTQLGCLSEAESAEMITKNLDAIGLSGVPGALLRGAACPGRGPLAGPRGGIRKSLPQRRTDGFQAGSAGCAEIGRRRRCPGERGTSEIGAGPGARQRHPPMGGQGPVPHPGSRPLHAPAPRAGIAGGPERRRRGCGQDRGGHWAGGTRNGLGLTMQSS